MRYLILLSMLFISMNENKIENQCDYQKWAIPEVAGEIYDIDPMAIRALLKIESNTRHQKYSDGWKIVKSDSDALGIAQIKQDTADFLGCGDITNRDENVMCAARYMAYIRDHRCGDDYECIVALYHDGHNRKLSRLSKAGKYHVRKFKREYERATYNDNH